MAPTANRYSHRLAEGLERGVGQVVEHHAQCGDPAQRVQPGEPFAAACREVASCDPGCACGAGWVAFGMVSQAIQPA
jgi:hypothetical protein